MTTAAAIDRVVHHATILELTCESYRANEAKQNNRRSSLSTKKKEADET